MLNKMKQKLEQKANQALNGNMNNANAGKLNYNLQILLQNTLLTLKVNNTKEADILKMANTITLEKIAQMTN